MSDVKDRFSNVLAWFAFFNWGLIILDIAFAYGVFPIDRWIVTDVYVTLVGFGALEYGAIIYTPITWVLLYILTGKPRILPWKN